MRLVRRIITPSSLLAGLAVFAITVGLGLSLTEGRAGGPGKPVPPDAPRALPTMAPFDRARHYQPGPAWDGRGKGPMTQADIESFGEYPLFWLGDSFAGYHLQWVGRVRYDAPADIPNARPWDAVTFIYGTCTPSVGQNRCAAPVTVHVRPACAVRPEMVADQVRAGGLETVRGGAQVQRFNDGHVVLWGGGVSVSIQAPGMPDVVDRAVVALRSVGRVATVGAGAPIPAPDFKGCPPLDLEAQRIFTR